MTDKCYCNEPDVYDGYAECPAHPHVETPKIPDEVRYEVFNRRPDGTLFDFPVTSIPYRRKEMAEAQAEEWNTEAQENYAMERRNPFVEATKPCTFVVVRQTVKREVL